jgi:hypothetical protein
MANDFPTDEDRQIERLLVHRNLVTWVIRALAQANISAICTVGNREEGDICIINPEDISLTKATLRAIQHSLHGYSAEPPAQAMPHRYIEIKAYSATTVTSTLVRILIQKATVMGVVTTAVITKPAKKLLDEADIAWVETFPEHQLDNIERE